MKNTKLIQSLFLTFMLGISSVALADDQSSSDEMSKDDEQSETEEAEARSGKVYGTHIARNADDLAQKLSNPISSLISVPLQYNFSRKYNSDGHKNLLNIQPVVPISISKDWNLISRSIMPIVQQKDVQPGRHQAGFGDLSQSVWASPKEPSKSGLIWGVGAVALIPTGTDGIGANTWGFGPTIVMLKQTGAWTYGVLANHLWDTSGPAEISSTFLQPFLSKGLGKGRTLSMNSESTYNWKSKDWTVPINLQYSKVSKWGNQMVSNQIGAGLYATSPEGGADWQLRYTLTLLFPKS